VPKLDVATIAAINKRPSKAVPGEVISAIQYAAEVTTFESIG